MSLVTPEIASLKPYVPGKPLEELERELGISGAIKLASNENPLGPSPKAIEAMKAACDGLNFYPEGDAPNLKDALSTHLGVDYSEIVIGNGSNEIIELLIRTFTTPEHHAVISNRAFLVYKMVLTGMRVPFTSVPMRAMRHDLEAMRAAVRPNTRLVFIANPNNPTGTYNSKSDVLTFLDGLSENIIVAFDEAYFEYVDAPDYPDAVTMREAHPNVVALRTFSKAYGLAGVRIGYGVARPEIARYLNTMRQPFNTNRVAQAGAAAALGDADYLAKSVALNRAQRTALSATLSERGHEVVPSQTNFLLLKTPRPGAQIVDALMRLGVIVRAMDGYGLPGYMRVTVGSADQNRRFTNALDQVLSGRGDPLDHER